MQSITFGQMEDNNGMFSLSSEATELYLKRCDNVTLREIQNILSLIVLGSQHLKLEVQNANPRLDVYVR